MFVLAEMQDAVRIEPHRFSHDMSQELTDELNKKFANKVVHKVGLCIALHDILHVGESYIFPGDGASHTKVRFRVIVFRPFMDEVLVGKIRSCSSEGVRVSLGFFDDIIIPHQSLQHPKRFDTKEHLWVWEYQTEEGTHDMFMDIDEEIRFRVIEENFVDISPTTKPKAEEGADRTAAAAAGGDGGSQDSEATALPYSIVGSVSESGLGLLKWWNG